MFELDNIHEAFLEMNERLATQERNLLEATRQILVLRIQNSGIQARLLKLEARPIAPETPWKE